MTFFVSAVGDGDEFVPYVGKVFEAGEYPDKAFAISPSELSESASGFGGVDLDLEHSEFRDLLGHRLGRLEKLWIDGRDAIGRLSVPRWLHELSGGRLQTSLTFDRAKRVVGCALTLSPRIRDAEVYAAFSVCNPVGVGDWGGGVTRVGPEANPSLRICSPVGASEGAELDWEVSAGQVSGWEPAGVSGGEGFGFCVDGKKEIGFMATSLKERLKVLFRKAPLAVEEAGIDPGEIDSVEFGDGRAVAGYPHPALSQGEREFSCVAQAGQGGSYPHPALSEGEREFSCVAPAGQGGSYPHPALSQGEREIGRQLAEFKATNDRLVAGQLHTCAALFADSVIREARAVPAQREQLVGLFKQAAIADGAGTIRFSTSGQVEEGANMKQLKELFRNAQPHTLFATEIPNADPNDSHADKGANKAVVDRLRKATSLGKATTQKEEK